MTPHRNCSHAVTRNRIRHRRGAATTVALITAAFSLLVAGCSDQQNASSDSSKKTTTESGSGGEEEVAQAQRRLVATYDGGLMVIDAAQNTVLDEFEVDGFNRIQPAGDERHVVVSTADAFRILDTGAWSEAHGDHAHHYAAGPELTDISFPTDHPGHVVRHGGETVLFSDGTGRIERFDPSGLADGRPATQVSKAKQPHHGVAVPLRDGRLLVSLGTEEEGGHGVVVLDRQGKEVARTTNCPGLHGEATATNGRILIGCENGALIYHDGNFEKVDSPDDYGRIGNQAGSPTSPVVLGDYKVKPNATLERPQRISLIDTRTGKLRLVDLGTSYSFRSLARGPNGEAVVLGTDGALRVIDETTGRVRSQIEVTEPWKEPVDWQRPRPTIYLDGPYAYVTEPASKTLHTVHLTQERVLESGKLPHVPNELTGVR